MGDLISRDALLAEYDKAHKGPPGGARKLIENAPPICRQEELLDDGTLVVWTNTDMSKFSRVNVRQIGTHYGDLFYPDEE